MTTRYKRRDMLKALGAFALLPLGGRSAFSAETPPLASRMAEYACSLKYEDLPPEVVEAVKAHFIDTIGCAIGAFNQPVVKSVRHLALNVPIKQATIIGTQSQSTMDLASFANGAAVRYFDLNDSYAGREVGHPSDNITPCVAVAEAEQAAGRDLILAIAIAYELDCRLLDTVQISAKGWDHPNFSLPATALAAGRLMKLTVDQLTEAVNLSLAGHLAFNQTRLQVLSNWKGLADAESGRNAIFADLLARGGITGPAPAFEGNAGFFKQVSGTFDLDFDQFGGRNGKFKILDCQIKPYPAQALLQTAIIAASNVGRQIKDPSMIQSIVVDTTHAGHQYSAESADKWAPKTRETADHSLPFIVARALLDHEITDASYSSDALSDPALKSLLSKLTVRDDDKLTKLYPQKLPTRVSVTLNDGRVIVEEIDDLPGFGGKPLTRSDIEAKFARTVKGLWRQRQAHAFFQSAWNLDTQGNLTAMLREMIVAS